MASDRRERAIALERAAIAFGLLMRGDGLVAALLAMTTSGGRGRARARRLEQRTYC